MSAGDDRAGSRGFGGAAAIAGIGETDYVRGAPFTARRADAAGGRHRDRRRGPRGRATSTASSRRPATRRARSSRPTSASTRSGSPRRCTWAARARPPRSSTQRSRSRRGQARQRARRRRLERLLRVPAPCPGVPRPRRGLDASAVGDVVARLLPAVRRALGRAVLRLDRDAAQAAVRHARHRHGRDRGDVPRPRAAQRKRADARHAADDGRVPRRPLGVGAVPPLRLLPRDRLRGRGRRHVHGAGARPAAPARGDPRRRRGPSVSRRRHREPPRHLPHRPHRRLRPAPWRTAGRARRRARLPADLRLLHLRRAAADSKRSDCANAAKRARSSATACSARRRRAPDQHARRTACRRDTCGA